MSTAQLIVPFPHKRNSREVRERANRERQADLKRKQDIDRAAQLLDRLEARAAEFDRRIKLLQKRKALACARVERIEDRALALMSQGQLAKLEGFHRTLQSRNAPAALVVEDQSQVPAEYLREKLISEVDKNAVKTALAKGVEIAGVRLTQKVSLIRK